MSNLVTKVRLSVVERGLVVGACLDKIKRAEREARKEQRQVPRAEMDRLQSDLRDARRNVDSAECSLAGCSKYPPLA